MNAFVPSTPLLSSSRPSLLSSSSSGRPLPTRRPSPSSSRVHAAPRMDVDTAPDVNGPPTSKYLQFIPVDRLNKAPVITINAFRDERCNNVGIMMPTLPADVAQGDAVKLSTEVDDEYLSRVPSPAKWSKYYPVETVNEAPVININYSPSATEEQTSVSLAMTTVFPPVEEAQTILGKDTDPDPALYPAYTDNLYKAPSLTIVPPESESDKGYVRISDIQTPLNSYAAQLILDKYRK